MDTNGRELNPFIRVYLRPFEVRKNRREDERIVRAVVQRKQSREVD